MDSYNTILDYVKEQANRDDINTLRYEQDTLNDISKAKNIIFRHILSCALPIANKISIETMISNMQELAARGTKIIYDILADAIKHMYNTAISNSENLFDVASMIENRKNNSGINTVEMYGGMDFDAGFEFIQNMSFNLLKNYEQNIIQELRADFGRLYLSGNFDIESVKKSIASILKLDNKYSSDQKIEEIAQTEMSRAYNFGVLKHAIDYRNRTGENVKKYWHGFPTSGRTCQYCMARIGHVYNLEDNTEELPAHPRCRCTWIIVADGWNNEINNGINNGINSNDNLFDNISETELRQKFASTLGINYANKVPIEVIKQYMRGNRSNDIMASIEKSRINYIRGVKANIYKEIGYSDIQRDSEFGNWLYNQIGFYVSVMASAQADRNSDLLKKLQPSIEYLYIFASNLNQSTIIDKLIRFIMKIIELIKN